MSSSNCCFLTCIQISQEAGQVTWYFPVFKNFPQFVFIHTVKSFVIISKAKVDVFLELSCFWMIEWMLAIRQMVLCLFENQLEHLEVHSSHTVEAWPGEF